MDMVEKQAKQAEWVTFTPGGRRRIVVDGEKLMNVEVTLEKGTVVAPHKHVHEQSTYIISGQVEFTISEQKTLVKAGQTNYIPSHAIHRLIAHETTLPPDSLYPPPEAFLPHESA